MLKRVKNLKYTTNVSYQKQGVSWCMELKKDTTEHDHIKEVFVEHDHTQLMLQRMLTRVQRARSEVRECKEAIDHTIA